MILAANGAAFDVEQAGRGRDLSSSTRSSAAWSHCPPLEQPAPFVAAVARFLDRS